MRQIQPAHLAEQAGNLRRGGEVATRTKRVTAVVIAFRPGAEPRTTKTHLHIIINANRAVFGDMTAQHIGKAGRFGCWHQARRHRIQPPAASIGRHRIWPIVTRPSTSPRCASGSRTYSMINLASPYPSRRMAVMVPVR